MKNYTRKILQLLLVLAAGMLHAQNPQEQMYACASYPLELTTAKTTHLVFPYDIISVDRGSENILAQKARGAANVLQVKAARSGFQQTSLTVITADKKLYGSTVDYVSNPLQTIIEFVAGPSAPAVHLQDPAYNQAELEEFSKNVLDQPKSVRGVRDKSIQSSFSLDGIFIHKDVTYYQLRLQNSSQLSYDIESVRFFVREKKRVKRTAIQEREIGPLLTRSSSGLVPAESTQLFVYALPKFTTDKGQYLSIELREKNGGRHLNLDVSARKIVGARAIAE